MSCPTTAQDVLRVLLGSGSAVPGVSNRTLLLVEPGTVDVAGLGSRSKLGVLLRDDEALQSLWHEVRHLPFDQRPLVMGGTPETLADDLPFRFDAMISLDQSLDGGRRINAAFDLLAPGGLLIRPAGEPDGTDRAAVYPAPEQGQWPALLGDRIEAVSLEARGEPVFGRPFEETDWTDVQAAVEAFHERSGDGREDRKRILEEDLLRIWSGAVARDVRPNRWPWSGRRSTAPRSFLDGRPWPMISVVVPTYNQGQYIEETLLSLVNQDYPNLDLIVMDGGSTDRTLEVVNRYRAHLTHFVSEPDRGQSHAINKGMALASGEILTWLNSDDMLAEGALHAMALAFAVSGADMVAGICRTHTNYHYDSEHLTSCADGVLPLDKILDLDGGWNAGQFFYQPEVFFSRRIWEKAGGSVREDLYYSMDYELWMRFAASQARIHVIGRPIALFRRHAQQKTHVAESFMKELVTVRDAYVAKTGAKAASNPFGTSPRKLSFCFLNDVGFEYGAGIAHRRLADAVTAAGHRVHPLQFMRHPGDAREPLPTAAGLADAVAATGCDIVVLGNVHHARPEPSLFAEVFRRWPTVIVVHDFWWVTGRCAYTHGCRMLEKGCDETCPTPAEYPSLPPDEIFGAWLQKRMLLQDHPNVVLAANSSWTREVIEGSKADIPGGVHQIRLGVDPTYFFARDKRTARLALGLPEDDLIVMMSTTSLNDPRKGTLAIIELLARQKIPGLKVVVLGHLSARERSTVPGFCILPGYITNKEQLLLYYAAVDLVVGASREETFGQVFAEAGALGTPVVAHGVTGMTDAVSDRLSGLLTRTASDVELVRLILLLKDRPHVARRLHELGPVYFENEHSIEASYRSFYQVLRRAGFLDRFGVRPNIGFVPRERRSVVPAGTDLASRENGRDWVGGAGVSWREHANPGLGFPTPFNWLEGPIAEVVLHSEDEGLRRIVFEYRNVFFDEQTMEIWINDILVMSRELARTPPHKVDVTSFQAQLRKGANDVRIKFGHWHLPEGDNRNLALALNGISRL